MHAHPPKRGLIVMGTQPKVHTGFYKAWTAGGLHTEVVGYLQVAAFLFVSAGGFRSGVVLAFDV